MSEVLISMSAAFSKKELPNCSPLTSMGAEEPNKNVSSRHTTRNADTPKVILREGIPLTVSEAWSCSRHWRTTAHATAPSAATPARYVNMRIMSTIFTSPQRLTLHFRQDVHQRDGTLFHLRGEVLYFREYIIVEQLQNNSHNDTEDGCDEGHFHA